MARTTLRARVRLLVVASSVAASFLAALVGWIALRGEMAEAVQDETNFAATLLALRFDPAAVQRLSEDPTGDRADLDALQAQANAFLLSTEGARNPPRNAYCLVPTRHGSTTGADLLFTGSAEGTPDWTAPGTPYNLKDEPARRISFDGPGGGIYDDAWGTWISGFAPIHDAEGKVIALAGVDIAYATAFSHLRQLLLLSLVCAIAIGVAAGLGADALVGRAMRPFRELGDFIRSVGKGEDPGALDLSRGGEAVALAADLNAMRTGLLERAALRRRTEDLAERVELQGDRLRELSELGQELHQTQDLDLLMERILAGARRALRADAGAIFVREGPMAALATMQNETVSSGMPGGKGLDEHPTRVRLDSGSVTGWVAATGGRVVEADVYAIGADRPYHFNKTFDRLHRYRTRAMLALPLRTANGEVLGVLQLMNPMGGGSHASFAAEDVAVAEHLAALATVPLERARLMRSILLRMIGMSQVHDPSETGAHVQRVAGYSLIIYDAWAAAHGIGGAEAAHSRDILRIAAMLHDVGKVGIPDAILKKPGRLTPEEFDSMKRHTVLGAKLFMEGDTFFDHAAAEVALHHHERWDGDGYPGPVVLATAGSTLEELKGTALGPPGLAGQEIPIFARIVALADVFDALSSRRQYKEPWPEDRVLHEIRAGRGTQFDPELVDILLARIDDARRIMKRHAGPTELVAEAHA